MTRRVPDFDDLVGPDVEGAQRERLQRVHELLVAAGPPPEISMVSVPAVDEAPAAPRRGRRRRGALLAFAAAAVAAVGAFVLGVAVADDEPTIDRVVAMSGPSGATAQLEIYELDDAGNWPMRIEAEGLPAEEDGPLLQLWLTKAGKPAALCGSFHVDDEGAVDVPMNAPWRLSDFDGWVVIAEGSKTPLLST